MLCFLAGRGIPTPRQMCFKVLADGLDERRSRQNRTGRERDSKRPSSICLQGSAAIIRVRPLLNPDIAFDPEGRRRQSRN
jgi:hypothetical protein